MKIAALSAALIFQHVLGGAVGSRFGHHENDDDVNPMKMLQQQTRFMKRLETLRQHGAHGGRHLEDIFSMNCTELCVGCIQIETRLHMLLSELEDDTAVIPHPTDAADILYEQLGFKNATANSTAADVLTAESFSSEQDIEAMFEENMQFLNVAFAETPFVFTWNKEEGRSVVNNTWNFYALVSEYQAEYRAAMGSNDPLVLNVYLAYQNLRGNGGRNANGTADLPGSGRPYDGIHLRYDVLPGGGHPLLSYGSVLIHEVGHWLGLLHTFNKVQLDGCTDPVGDFVDDTAFQAAATEDLFPNCSAYLPGNNSNPQLPDTCPDDGLGPDPFFNWMKYITPGYCMMEAGTFTCGQVERMYQQWIVFREHLSLCENADDEFELEIVVQIFDEKYPFENYEAFLIHTTSNGKVLINFEGSFVFSGPQDLAYVPRVADMCLPRSNSYQFIQKDAAGDGFNASGLIEIYVDGALYDEIEGNFGNEVVIDITADAMVASSRQPDNDNKSIQAETGEEEDVSSSDMYSSAGWSCLGAVFAMSVTAFIGFLA